MYSATFTANKNIGQVLPNGSVTVDYYLRSKFVIKLGYSNFYNEFLKNLIFPDTHFSPLSKLNMQIRSHLSTPLAPNSFFLSE